VGLALVIPIPSYAGGITRTHIDDYFEVAQQARRSMGVASYKTAWIMCNTICVPLGNVECKKLVISVETDETYGRAAHS